MRREIEILKWLNHKNVIRVFDVIDGEHKFFIVMELAPNGDLLSLLHERHKLTEDEAKVMFTSIVEGVLYCHKKGRYKNRYIKCGYIFNSQIDHNYFSLERGNHNSQLCKTNVQVSLRIKPNLNCFST